MDTRLSRERKGIETPWDRHMLKSNELPEETDKPLYLFDISKLLFGREYPQTQEEHLEAWRYFIDQPAIKARLAKVEHVFQTGKESRPQEGFVSVTEKRVDSN